MGLNSNRTIILFNINFNYFEIVIMNHILLHVFVFICPMYLIVVSWYKLKTSFHCFIWGGSLSATEWRCGNWNVSEQFDRCELFLNLLLITSSSFASSSSAWWWNQGTNKEKMLLVFWWCLSEFNWPQA